MEKMKNQSVQFCFQKFISYAQRYNNPVFLLILFGHNKQSFKATGMLDKIINIKLKDDNQIVTATTPNAACFFKCPFLVFSILQF